MSVIAISSGTCYRIKVKTANQTTVFTAVHTNAQHAWDRAWSIAGTSAASISVQVVR